MEQPQFNPVNAAMMKRLEKWQAEHEGEPIGNVATKLLFEDEKVRIWEMWLEPGQGSDLHHHADDYYLVMLSGDKIAGIPPKATGVKPYVADLPPGGTTVFVKGGDTEWAVNVGKETFYEILVELKGQKR